MGIGILVHLLFIILIVALVFYALNYVPLPPPFGWVVRVIVALIVILILLGSLNGGYGYGANWWR